jgi:hypothetical protein
MRIFIRMTQAQRVIEKFGGLTAMAKALGHEHPTTVQGWKERGFIPAKRHQEVLDAAAALKIDLNVSDFFDRPFESPPKPKKRARGDA